MTTPKVDVSARNVIKDSPAIFVPHHTWHEKGWLPIDGQQRSAAGLPAEVVIRDRLSLEPYLVVIRQQ